jgi:hypothetical protein
MPRRGRGGSPVSLFAFQDIITSVTGIMILVTLFLALELINRREGSPDVQTAALTAEIQEAVQQADQTQSAITSIRKQIDVLKSELADRETTLNQEVRFDVDELKGKLRYLEELNEIMTKELAQSRQRHAAAEESLEELKAQDEQRNDDRKQLADMARQAQQKLRELQKLKQTNRVIFNPGQGSAKTPWLIELTLGNIQAAEPGKSGSPQSFADVKALLAWAAKRSRSGEYFVLLLKPETIEEFHAARLGLEQQGFDVGFDLLGSTQSAIDSSLGAPSP